MAETGLAVLLNWRQFSSLQKLLILASLILLASFLSSHGTLMLSFVSAVGGGIYLTNQFLLHEKASLYAEQFFYILESAYIELVSTFSKAKQVVVGNTFETPHSSVSSEIINELKCIYDSEVEKPQDGSSMVKMSTSLRLEMNSIQLLIIRDFVRSWYADFSYDAQFLKEVKCVLQDVFSVVALRLSHQNSKLIASRVIQLYRVHLTLFQKAKSSFESHQIHPKTKVPLDSKVKRHSSVDEAFENVCSFHVALENEEMELNYIRGVVSIVVFSLLQREVKEGPCSRTLLVEILSNQVLLPIMQMMSEPDWLTEIIIRLTSDEEVSSRSSVGDFSEDIIPPAEVEKTETDFILQRPLSSITENQFDSSQVFHDCIPEDIDKVSSKQLTKDVDSESKNVPEADVCDMRQRVSDESTKCVPSSVTKMKSQSLSPSLPSDSIGSDTIVLNDSTADLNSTVVNGDVTVTSHNISHSPPCAGHIPMHDTNPFFKNFREEANEMVSQSDLDGGSSVVPESQSGTDNESVDSSGEFLLDPQAILSFGRNSSVTSLESDSSSSLKHSSSLMNSTESEGGSESVHSSFPKFSSLKSFFVDSLKPSGIQNLKKPRTLSLFSSKQKGKESEPQNVPPCAPQVLVDGVPVEEANRKMSSSISSFPSISSNGDHQHYGSGSDSENTPSPGFFSSMRPFFGMSSSHYEVSHQSPAELSEESPLPTPSPTTHADHILDSISEGKDIEDSESTITKPRGLSTSYVVDDRRIFQDVAIPNTEISTEYRSSAQYCLYIIEYEALYFTEEGKSVIRSGVVKRRHREFTTLQSRLEGHAEYKKYLKKIRGPKRWTSLPFKSMDKDTVENRRVFLEKYLKDLIEMEAMCNGPDLREFLAYEGNSHIAFVKKSPDISVPRFDKMFMRGVSGVVDRLKALPNIPQEVMSGLRGKETPEEKISRDQTQFDVDTIDLSIGVWEDQTSSLSCQLPVTAEQIVTDCETDEGEDRDLFHMSEVIADHKGWEQVKEVYHQEVDKVLTSLPGVSHSVDQTEQELPKDDLELSLVVLDLLVQGLQGRDLWLCKERMVQAVQAVLGKALCRYLESAILTLTSEPQLTAYLRLLRETVWPQGQLWSDSPPPRSPEEREALQQQAKRCLINFFPESVRLVIGQQEFDKLMDVFLNSLGSKQLNRHILYQILDLLVEHLLPEIADRDKLQELLLCKAKADAR